MCYNEIMTITELEKARIAYRNKILIYVGVILLVIIVSFAAFLPPLLLSGTQPDTKSVVFAILAPILILIVPAVAGITGMIYQNRNHEKTSTAYRKAYKAYFIAPVLQQIFTDLTYDHAVGLPRYVTDEAEALKRGNFYHSNDYTTADYKGIKFSQADVHIEAGYTSELGNPRRITLFKGQYMTFKLKKHFDRKLVIVGRKFRGENTFKEGFEKVEVESSEFNRIFDVYAQDGFEAFYLLDPTFIARLEQIGRKYHGKIMLCVFNDQLHIAINGENMFEPPFPFRRINEAREAKKVHGEINSTVSLVDALKLE